MNKKFWAKYSPLFKNIALAGRDILTRTDQAKNGVNIVSTPPGWWWVLRNFQILPKCFQNIGGS